MWIKKWAPSIGAGLLLALGAGHAGAQVKLQTFVLGISGVSSESVGVPVGPVRDNFYNVNPTPIYVPISAVDDPAKLAAVGVSGTYRLTSSLVAPLLSDATTITEARSFGDFGSYSFEGSSTATTAYGQLKSAAQATHITAVAPDIRVTQGTGAFSKMTEQFTVNSPNVTLLSSGVMRIAITINGNLSISGTGSATVGLWSSYGDNTVANNLLLEAGGAIYPGAVELYGPNSSFGSFTPPAGMSLSFGPLNANGIPTSLSFGGTGTVYADVPILFGSGQDFTLGLLATAGPNVGVGSSFSQFDHTATLSGIQVFDAGGQELHDFTITSGSGTLYDATGVHLSATAAPEPTTCTLLILGSIPLSGVIWRRQKCIARLFLIDGT